MSSLREYFDAESQLRSRIPLALLESVLAALQAARKARRQVFLFGNGGSASTASHFACDLGKGTVRERYPRFKAIALADHLATFSAYANDQGYESVFSEPLTSLAERGDIAIGFSVSGNSPNVLRAMDTAHALGLLTIGFTGFDGGKLGARVEQHLNIPSESFGIVEDLHLAMTHALCDMLKIEHE